MEQTDLMDNHWGITYPVSYRRGPRWPWTSRWRTYANGVLLQLVAQPKCRSSNK
jgi:hypothetical protein